MDPGGQNQFLVKKSKVQFFDQNWPKNLRWRSQIDFGSKNEKFKFSTKNGPWELKVDLVENLKTQFLDQKWTLEVKNQFLVKKSKVPFFDQN